MLKNAVSVLCLLLIAGIPVPAVYTQPIELDIDSVSHAAVQVRAGDTKGSGSLLIHEGQPIVFTNRHVIDGHSEAEISVLVDLNEPAVPMFNARLRGYSNAYDFAVLDLVSDMQGNSITISELQSGALGFVVPTLRLPSAGKDGDVRRGTAVGILGYPGIGDNEMVYTTGIVSSVQFGEYNGNRLPLWYRTTAGMSPGNSGGMALNSRGEFIGIPTSVRHEEITGGRLGSLLAGPFAMALLEDRNALLTSWEDDKPGSGNSKLDVTLEPAFGAAQLGSTEVARRHSVALASAGSVDVSYLGKGCAGYAAVQPDYRFSISQSVPNLGVMFTADKEDEDTVLIINAPDGSWHCNDDMDLDITDPGLTFSDATSGQYDVWVASYARGKEIAGELMVFDLDRFDISEPVASRSANGLDIKGEPFFGSIALATGFLPEMYTQQIMGGGHISMQEDLNISDCRGYASNPPDFSLEWTGSAAELSVFFVTEVGHEDGTLAINTPNGSWLCNDDASATTLNPGITINSPDAGIYDIWVGSYEQGKWVHGLLHISEIRPSVP